MAGLKLSGPDPASKARALLDAAGLMIEDERPIQHAVQLRLEGGVIVNVFTTTGSVVVQGKGAGAVSAVLAAARGGDAGPSARHPSSTRPSALPSSSEPAVRLDEAPVSPDHANPRWIGHWEDWDGVSPPW